MAQVAPSSAPVYDVVIVGSGAGGGTVTQVLTGMGISVALLEAGPMLNPGRDFKEHMWPWQVDHRGLGPGCQSYFGKQYPFGYFSASAGDWELENEPYTVAEGSRFQWFRSRILGGRTNHYGRFSFRFADYDFKPHSRDGLGTDWPIGYDDIAPYYSKAEAFIGVTGTEEHMRGVPDGVFLPAPPPRVHEALVQRACRKLGIPCIPNRMAVLTKPLNGRPACHYCGQCGRGCVGASNYSSSQVQIIPALKTGRLKLFTGAMARELIADDSGRVTAVSYVDKATREERQIRCRTVVLAASACESARLLLNSRSSRWSSGLANGSGMVGRNLMDSVGYGMEAEVPALAGMPKYNSDGMGGMHVFVPWWLAERNDLGFPRGYHIEIGGGFIMPMAGQFGGVCETHEGYGLSLKNAIRDGYGTRVHFAGRGEMIPNPDSFCDIDPEVVDAWGIPVLRFHFRWSDAELNQAVHMQETFRAIFDSMGARQLKPGKEGVGISVGGEIIHEVGTVRMGDDPKTSVLNRYCQAHEVKNLFVADGAPFVSNPDKNPTLTICALAWRTAEYLAEEMRNGNV